MDSAGLALNAAQENKLENRLLSEHLTNRFYIKYIF